MAHITPYDKPIPRRGETQVLSIMFSDLENWEFWILLELCFHAVKSPSFFKGIHCSPSHPVIVKCPLLISKAAQLDQALRGSKFLQSNGKLKVCGKISLPPPSKKRKLPKRAEYPNSEEQAMIVFRLNGILATWRQSRGAKPAWWLSWRKASYLLVTSLQFWGSSAYPCLFTCPRKSSKESPSQCWALEGLADEHAKPHPLSISPVSLEGIKIWACQFLIHTFKNVCMSCKGAKKCSSKRWASELGDTLWYPTSIEYYPHHLF